MSRYSPIKARNKILEYLAENGNSSTRKIANYIGLSGDRNEVMGFLKNAESEGVISGHKNSLNHFVWNLSNNQLPHQRNPEQ